MKRVYTKEKSEFIERNKVHKVEVFSEESIKDLPEPLKKYIRVCGFIDTPVPVCADVYWEESWLKMSPDYLSYIKNYFRRAHKIGDGNGMLLFKSPKNSLWRDDEQKSVSPTERNVYYKFNENSFEVIIPPYNPMVKGRIIRRTINEIVCKSFDFNREFVFCYNETISPDNLEMIKMYRHDKDDMVVYHK